MTAAAMALRRTSPLPDDWFTAYEVSTRVNKPDNNDADLLADRVRGAEEARRVAVIAIAGREPRQAIDYVGEMQKSMGLRGDHQSVMGVPLGLLGFALSEGDVGARFER